MPRYVTRAEAPMIIDGAMMLIRVPGAADG